MEISKEQKEKLIRKIHKSLKLSSNNPNENEAQTALLKAQELMAKYNLSLSEIDMQEEFGQRKEVDTNVVYTGKLKWWMRKLANIIGDNFRCYWFWSTVNRKHKVQFLGLKEDVEIVKEVYNFAIDVIEYYSKMYILENMISGKEEIERTKNDYISGFLSGLREKFEEQVNKNDWGLILLKDALVEEKYSSMKFRNAKSSNSSFGGDLGARNEGYKRGRDFEGSGRKKIE